MLNIKQETSYTNDHIWDRYVSANPRATLYHLCAWRRIINRVYGHDVYYLVAAGDDRRLRVCRLEELDGKVPGNGHADDDNIRGVLPLVHLRSFVFGNDLISVPFFDMGGILADDAHVESALLNEALQLGRILNASTIQLRQTSSLISMAKSGVHGSTSSTSCIRPNLEYSTQIALRKARMLLDLPTSSDALMDSFKSKLRSQIRKPIKEGLTAAIGRLDLLDDFYEVFCINMRDLGSPVHSKAFIREVLENFPDHSHICIVHGQGRPLAGSLIIGFKDTLHNPWASSLRDYSKLSPNMLLYWTMLKFACDNGYRRFDFGRSSIDESTYRFKEQWGAGPQTLHWHHITCKGNLPCSEKSDKSRFDAAIRIWQKFPVPLTKIIGPPVRKYIGL